jgi:hypothetical protein
MRKRRISISSCWWAEALKGKPGYQRPLVQANACLMTGRQHRSGTSADGEPAGMVFCVAVNCKAEVPEQKVAEPS